MLHVTIKSWSPAHPYLIKRTGQNTRQMRGDWMSHPRGHYICKRVGPVSLGHVNVWGGGVRTRECWRDQDLWIFGRGGVRICGDVSVHTYRIDKWYSGSALLLWKTTRVDSRSLYCMTRNVRQRLYSPISPWMSVSKLKTRRIPMRIFSLLVRLCLD